MCMTHHHDHDQIIYGKYIHNIISIKFLFYFFTYITRSLTRKVIKKRKFFLQTHMLFSYIYKKKKKNNLKQHVFMPFSRFLTIIKNKRKIK